MELSLAGRELMLPLRQSCFLLRERFFPLGKRLFAVVQDGLPSLDFHIGRLILAKLISKALTSQELLFGQDPFRVLTAGRKLAPLRGQRCFRGGERLFSLPQLGQLLLRPEPCQAQLVVELRRSGVDLRFPVLDPAEPLLEVVGKLSRLMLELLLPIRQGFRRGELLKRWLLQLDCIFQFSGGRRHFRASPDSGHLQHGGMDRRLRWTSDRVRPVDPAGRDSLAFEVFHNVVWAHGCAYSLATKQFVAGPFRGSAVKFDATGRVVLF